MFRLWLVLFSIGQFLSLSASQPAALFLINPSERGYYLHKLFDSLKSTYATSSTEILLQTTASPPFLFVPTYFNDLNRTGIIPYMQDLIPAPNYTLFIAAFQPNPPRSLPTQYRIVGIEQIVDIVYFPSGNVPAHPSPFTSTFLSNVLPFYQIDPVLRAQDILFILKTLLQSSYKLSVNTQVAVQTTLNGPFYPQFTNGLIPNVHLSVTDPSASLSVTGSLLTIPYKTVDNLAKGSVTVAAEQVQQIIYYPYGPPLL